MFDNNNNKKQPLLYYYLQNETKGMEIGMVLIAWPKHVRFLYVEVFHLSLFITHITLSTLLILAVCRTRVTYEPRTNGQALHESLVAQWLERPTGIWEAMGRD